MIITKGKTWINEQGMRCRIVKAGEPLPGVPHRSVVSRRWPRDDRGRWVPRKLRLVKAEG